MVDTVKRKELEPIFKKIMDVLVVKDEEYGASWKEDGGPGAYFNLSRKWSRFRHFAKVETPELDKYDIFARALADERKEGIEADIDDLIGYLALVRVEIGKLRKTSKF